MAKQPKSDIKLPSMLAEIADVIGLDATIRLAAEVGGTTRYIPAKLKPPSWLIEVIGRRAAERLCRHNATGRSGSELYFPRLPNWIVVHVLTELGKTRREIARSINITERSVSRCRAMRLAVNGLTLEPVGATRRAVFKQLGLTDEDVRRYGAETL